MNSEYFFKCVRRYGIYYLYLILTLMCIYVSFGNLDVASVQHWDEARHGVNAYEMMKGGNFPVIYPFYNHHASILSYCKVADEAFTYLSGPVDFMLFWFSFRQFQLHDHPLF